MKFFLTVIRRRNYSKYALSLDQINKYHQNGYVIVRNMIKNDEISILQNVCKRDRELDLAQIDRDDADGLKSRLTLMNKVGNNTYGVFAGLSRIVDSVKKILDDEVYHYHSKVMLKEKRTGGAWEFHQDYGYWYQNAILYPRMLSVMIAVDRHTKENGCMQLLKGSHKFGRINHKLTGDQAGCDPQRVKWAKERLELVYFEAEPGDVLFFDSLLLHASQPNISPYDRWSYIICYNAKSNNPLRLHHHSSYHPLKVYPDNYITEFGEVPITKNDGTVFMTDAEDRSAQSLDDDEIV